VKVTDNSVPATELIEVIKSSVRRAGVSPAADLRVSSVQLILRVIATSTVGGGLAFRVPVVGMEVSFGGKITRQDTHTIDITLAPPGVAAGYELRDRDVADAVVDAVSTIRAVVASATAGDDPWQLSASTVDITFVITETGAISIGVAGEVGSEVAHTLRLGLAAS
jgi:hypothetical protein